MKHSISYKILSSTAFRKADHSITAHKTAIDNYCNHLVKWNKRVNLISRNVSRETLKEHVRHSLLISSLEPFKSCDLIVDAGTGGGLPGIPLAITHPEKQFVLNDIVSKKVWAVKQMIREINPTNIKTSDASIEELKVKNPFLLVSKHAFKINELFKYTVRMPWEAIIFYKSTDIEKELEEIDESLDITVFDLECNNSSSFYEGKGLIAVKRQQKN